jgi:hypothetical protein
MRSEGTYCGGFVLLLDAHMAYTAILKRIRLLIPTKLDGHYKAVWRAFEEGDLTAPSLPISEMELARAISEFTSLPPPGGFFRARERLRSKAMWMLTHAENRPCGYMLRNSMKAVLRI